MRREQATIQGEDILCSWASKHPSAQHPPEYIVHHHTMATSIYLRTDEGRVKWPKNHWKKFWTGSPTVRIRAIGFYAALNLRRNFHLMLAYLQRQHLSNPHRMGTNVTNTVRRTMVTGVENTAVLRSSSQGSPPSLISHIHHSPTKNEMIRHLMYHTKPRWRLGVYVSCHLSTRLCPRNTILAALKGLLLRSGPCSTTAPSGSLQ